MKKRKPDLSRFGLNWLVCVVVCMSRIDMSRLRRWSVYCLTSVTRRDVGFLITTWNGLNYLIVAQTTDRMIDQTECFRE
jgi:hypothetical protein